MTDLIKVSAELVTANMAIRAANQKKQAELKMETQRLETEARNRTVRDAKIARQQANYQAKQKQIIEETKMNAKKNKNNKIICFFDEN